MGMVGLFFALLFVAVVAYAISARTEKRVPFVIGLAASLSALVVALVAFNASGTSGGHYVTYVNGVRTSQGSVSAGQWVALLLIFGAICFGGALGLGTLIGRPRDKSVVGDERTGLHIFSFVVSLMGIPFSAGFIGPGLSNLIRSQPLTTADLTFLLVGLAIFGLCVWGIVAFIGWKKRTK